MDEDIISLEVPRSAEEAKQSMHFKDSMRERSLAGRHRAHVQSAVVVVGALGVRCWYCPFREGAWLLCRIGWYR